MKEKDIINEIKYLYICEMHSKDLEKREIKYLREIERLHSIIKEVREYIENNLYGDYGYECKQSKKELLEILKGENKNENIK